MNLLSNVLQQQVQTNSLPSEWLYVDYCVICRGVVGARSPRPYGRYRHLNGGGPFTVRSQDDYHVRLTPR
jgi:MarR-like DNA-binding transcriptional regulator SgrR of sgrS sRNA